MAAMLGFKLTTPNVNYDWWKTSKNELNKLVTDYNKQMQAKQVDPVTLQPWKPRKPPTGSWPLLRRTGKMLDTQKIKPGKSPMMFNARTTYYGPYLQYGTKYMPARRWLGIGEQILNPMSKVIASKIFKGKKTVTTIP